MSSPKRDSVPETHPARPGGFFPESMGDELLSSKSHEVQLRAGLLWVMAVNVWGTGEAAEEFLHRPHALLDMHTPVDVMMADESGYLQVEAILGRLQNGSAA